MRNKLKKKHENRPLISIITVVYNSKKLLEKTINSVITQTYVNIEYIIIDAGSTDGTVDIIKKYEDNIDYWLSEKDEGIYDGMNKGIDKSSGEWIFFLNSGDLFKTKEVLAEIFDKPIYSQNSDILYGDIDIDYKTFKKHKKAGSLINITKKMQFSHQSIFIKRNIITKNKFDTSFRYAADYQMIYNFYKEGRAFFNTKKTVSIILPGGISDISQIDVFKEYSIVNKKNFVLIIFLLKLKYHLKNILPDFAVSLIRKYK